MLNSNFDLRSFLTESKNPTLSEGEYKDKGQSAELNKERLQALKAKKAEMEKKGVPAGLIATVDKQIGELEKLVSEVLSEATVMEYIRERMTEMNNEVRSCMREYLTAVNEIDPGHEDAHAQLMGALEDFYNKLKAHFEADAMEDPMPGDEEPPVVLPSDAPSRELDGSPMIEGEEEDEAFGGEEDELEERTYFDPYDELEEGSYTAQDGNEYKASYNLYVDGEKVANFESEDLAKAELEKYKEKHGDSSDIVIKPAHDPVEEVKVKVDIPGQDSFEAEEGKEYSEEEADKYIKNAKDSEATPMNTKFSKVNEEEVVNEDAGIYQGLVDTAMNMGSEKDTALFLAGLVKTVVHLGAVPALVAALYPFKDKPVVQKLLAKLEKFVDAD